MTASPFSRQPTSRRSPPVPALSSPRRFVLGTFGTRPAPRTEQQPIASLALPVARHARMAGSLSEVRPARKKEPHVPNDALQKGRSKGHVRPVIARMEYGCDGAYLFTPGDACATVLSCEKKR